MPGNFAAQERITGATLTALAIADVSVLPGTLFWVLIMIREHSGNAVS
jgi:hypothetical protein